MSGQKQLLRALSLRVRVNKRSMTYEKLTWAVLSDNVIDELGLDGVHNEVCGPRDEVAIS